MSVNLLIQNVLINITCAGQIFAYKAVSDYWNVQVIQILCAFTQKEQSEHYILCVCVCNFACTALSNPYLVNIMSEKVR
jgi:hypothetical protein